MREQINKLLWFIFLKAGKDLKNIWTHIGPAAFLFLKFGSLPEDDFVFFICLMSYNYR